MIRMPRPSLTVPVNPKVLSWARESAGWTVEELAKKLKVSVDTVRRFEDGNRRPTLKTLEKLAGWFKRPLAAFMLASPPKEPPAPADFRKLPDSKEAFSKETLLSLRRARRLKTLAADLMDDLKLAKSLSVHWFSLEDEPEAAADTVRENLGLDLAAQIQWRDARHAYGEWRSAIERRHVLVFQARMPLDNARGFSLGDEPPFAIVINSTDAVQARSFTLFHEFGHLLLQKPGICLPEESHHEEDGRVEWWCNRFAGAVLFPETALEYEKKCNEGRLPAISKEGIEKLASRYKISRQVVLLRLLHLEVINNAQYLKHVREIKPVKSEKAPQKNFKINPAVLCVADRGKLFTSLVLEGRQKGSITFADVSDYLGVGLKHVDKVKQIISR
jgi:Zn-dependent peptidase ImmA (M78 family)/DNA-binding XRE family transcriptional regulator